MKENDKQIATENAFLAAAGWKRGHDMQRNVYYFQHMQVGPTETAATTSPTDCGTKLVGCRVHHR